MIKYIPLFLSLALLVGTGCGSSGATSSRANNTHRQSLGAHPASNILRIAEEALLSRYGYRYFRLEDTIQDLYIETEWKDLTAFDDERANGIDFVRIRIYIEARPRNRTPGIAGSFSATFRSEVQQHLNMTDEWVERDLSEQRREYLEEISEFMETELRIAFR